MIRAMDVYGRSRDEEKRRLSPPPSSMTAGWLRNAGKAKAMERAREPEAEKRRWTQAEMEAKPRRSRRARRRRGNARLGGEEREAKVEAARKGCEAKAEAARAARLKPSGAREREMKAM